MQALCLAKGEIPAAEFQPLVVHLVLDQTPKVTGFFWGPEAPYVLHQIQ
jgi:hypothetical protein